MTAIGSLLFAGPEPRGSGARTPANLVPNEPQLPVKGCLQDRTVIVADLDGHVAKRLADKVGPSDVHERTCRFRLYSFDVRQFYADFIWEQLFAIANIKKISLHLGKC
jgi:hypothetical protein